jgi:uncharacterized protein with PIN domain
MNYKFVVDKSLGKLSKWLRILGFDTLYEGDAPSLYFEQEIDSDRVILTRTKRIQKQFSSQALIFIESNDPNAQLEQVIKDLGIEKTDIHLFARCLECNIPIAGVAKEEMFGQVPDYVYETNNTFHKCSKCNKIYWPGSHGTRIMQRIEEMFK